MQQYGQFCPVALGAEIFAERWTPLILRELLLGSHRFSELQRGLPKISRNLLVQRLAYLEETGLLERRRRPNGRGFEYHLTAAGFADSLAQLGAGRAVARGLAWGTEVADEILAWRAGDGFDAVLPPYVPVNLPGRWQPTPPTMGPPLFRQFAAMTPFGARLSVAVPACRAAVARERALCPRLRRGEGAREPDERPAHARGDGDGEVLAARHTRRDVEPRRRRPRRRPRHEPRPRGPHPGPDERGAGRHDHRDLEREERLRHLEADHGNPGRGHRRHPATSPDPTWAPLLPTPQFQEYPSAHSGVSAAATSVLAEAYGDDTSFRVLSTGLPGVERDFTSFSAAVEQVVDARIFAGFHFRFACEDAARMGRDVADYVDDTVAVRAHGDEDDD